MTPPASGAVFGRERVPLLTAAEAEALDRRAQSDGFPGRALMENAGRAAAAIIQRLHPSGHVIAVVGGGNNGGDALVALRSLRAWGREVAWIPATSSDPDPVLLGGVDIPRLGPDEADRAFAAAGVLVDGILGTGARGAPREPVAGLIRRMNGSGRPIVALDIPTGVDPTTGEIAGEAIAAAETVMFGWPKRGALFHPGRAWCGRLVAVEIGFPPVDDGFEAALITPDWARSRLPDRPPDAHKNTVGRVLVVAGRSGMSGAAAIAGRSAVRAGAGLVRLVADEASRLVIQSHVPEGLFVDRSDRDAVLEALAASDAVLIGPAIGTGEDGAGLLDAILERLDDRACVLDADALTILAGRDGALADLDHRFVLTPHAGEMSRLTGAPTGRIVADPIGHAAELAGEMAGAAVLLKGAPSVVAAPGRPAMASAVGSSDQASAAMGDQLGATIATFAAAGATPPDAAALGLFYGGRASEIARRGRGLTPDDVADHLTAAFDDPGPDRSPLDLPFVVFDQPTRW